jgi:hypothetical protein
MTTDTTGTSGTTVDQAMDECVAEVEAGAKDLGFAIAAGAMPVLRGRFKSQFEKVLNGTKCTWDEIGNDVRRMARYLGAFAARNAFAMQEVEVSKESLFDAARFVQKTCPVGSQCRGGSDRKAVCDGVNLKD